MQQSQIAPYCPQPQTGTVAYGIGSDDMSHQQRAPPEIWTAFASCTHLDTGASEGSRPECVLHQQLNLKEKTKSEVIILNILE